MKSIKRIFLICLALCATSSAFAVKFVYSGPYLQAVTKDAAYIVWFTDKNSEGWVEVKGPGIKKAIFTSAGNGLKYVKRNHQVPIVGLVPGSTYEYKVFSKDPKSGEIISTAVNSKGEKLTFVTCDPNKKEFNFIMLTDIHYNRHFKGEMIFQKLLTPERLAGKDFVIFDGDMVTTMSGEKWHYDRIFTAATEMFASNVQYYMARGNHETRGAIANRYLEYHPTWTNQPYFAFRHGPVFFIFLDSGEDKPDNDIEYYGTAVFDDYRKREGEWLAEVVKSEEFKSAKYRVIINHIPLNDKSWHGGRHAYAMFTPHIDNGEITLMISGHTHRYSYRDLGKDNQTYPTLVFAPKQYLDINVTEEKLTINVHQMNGTLHKTFTYSPKK